MRVVQRAAQVSDAGPELHDPVDVDHKDGGSAVVRYRLYSASQGERFGDWGGFVF